MSTSIRPTITLSSKANAALTKRTAAHNEATGDALTDSQFLATHAVALCEGWAADDHAARLNELGAGLRLLPQETLDEIAAICEERIAEAMGV